MKRVIFSGPLAAVLIMALDAHGESWYLEKNESARAEDGAWSSVTNAYSWVNDAGLHNGNPGEPLSPTEDYIVGGGKTAVTLKGGTESASTIFKGKSMVIGTGGGEGRIRHCAYGEAYTTWDDWGRNEGLRLFNGKYIGYIGAHSAEIYGKVRIASPSSRPFILAYAHVNSMMRWHGDFSGDPGTRFNIEGYNYTSANRTPLSGTCTAFLGSFTNYFGDVTVSNTVMACGSTVLGGRLALGKGSCLTTVAADDVFTVGSLYADGASISINAEVDAEGGRVLQNGIIAVTNSLDVVKTVTVSADGDLYLAVTNTATRIPVMTVPRSIDINPGMFSMDRARFIVTTNQLDGSRTLVAVVAPTVVYNTVKEMGVADATWSDGAPAHGRAEYVLQEAAGGDAVLATPSQDDYHFPGNRLTISKGCTLRPYNRTLTIDELRFQNSGLFISTTDLDLTLKGRIHLLPEAIAFMGVYGGRTLNVASDIFGDESSRIVMDGRHVSTGTRGGHTRLTGDNSRFFGGITVGLKLDPKSLEEDKHHQRLYVSDPAKLGAPRTSFLATALLVKRFARLVTEGSVVFSDTTRGIFVGDDGGDIGGKGSEGRFDVGEGDTLTVLTQLTLNGRLHKYGQGTLALGGALKFGRASAIGVSRFHAPTTLRWLKDASSLLPWIRSTAWRFRSPRAPAALCWTLPRPTCRFGNLDCATRKPAIRSRRHRERGYQ